jgi:hypothetical protein
MDKVTEISSSSSSLITTQNQAIINYLEQLTPLQKIAYEIAKDHLKTSFDITRSNGFNEWLSSQKK